MGLFADKTDGKLSTYSNKMQAFLVNIVNVYSITCTELITLLY